MSYYDDHKDEADKAGVTSAQIEDFARRNPGHEGRGSDYGRAIEALTNYTGDRPFDSQSNFYDQRTNQLSPSGIAELQRRGGRAPARDLPAGYESLALPPRQASTSAGNPWLQGSGGGAPRNLGQLTGLTQGAQQELFPGAQQQYASLMQQGPPFPGAVLQFNPWSHSYVWTHPGTRF